MSCTLREARADDAAAMAALDADATPFPWNERHYQDSIASHHSWLLTENDTIVGLLVFSRVLDEMELLNVVVSPQQQGRGFGRLLMDHLLAEGRGGGAGRIFLEVRASNRRAIDLYRHYGFTTTGQRKNYYPAATGRETAILMTFEYE